jgi:hypothetical protein
MNNQSLFHYGGIAAIVSAGLYVLSLGAAFSGSESLGSTVYIVSSIFFLVVIVVVYMDLRSTGNLPALIGLLLLGIMTIWSMFIDPADISPIFVPLTLAYGVGFALFGWVQLRSSGHPNGLGYLAIATGVIAVIAAIALMAGASADVFGLLNLVLSVPYLIWLVWLGVNYLKGKAASLQAA